MELALARKNNEQERTVAIFPVFVGTNPRLTVNGKPDTEVYAKCAIPSASSFPDVDHARSVHIAGALTIKGTFAEIFKLQGLHVNPQDSLFELTAKLFDALARVNGARKEWLLDPCL